MANPIHEWIKGAVYALRERLTIGYDEDIDINNLEGEE